MSLYTTAKPSLKSMKTKTFPIPPKHQQTTIQFVNVDSIFHIHEKIQQRNKKFISLICNIYKQ